MGGCESRSVTTVRVTRRSGVIYQHQRGWGARLGGMVNRSQRLQASLCIIRIPARPQAVRGQRGERTETFIILSEYLLGLL